MPVVVGLLQRVGDVGHPVAVAPVDRQAEPARGDLGVEGGLQLTVVLVDRRDAAEVAVVVRDLFEASVGDASATRHVPQVRDHVVLTLRAAEAEQQHGVVRDRFGGVGLAGAGRGGRARDAASVGDGGVGRARRLRPERFRFGRGCQSFGGHQLSTSASSVISTRRPV